jgi:hypothetical protein
MKSGSRRERPITARHFSRFEEGVKVRGIDYVNATAGAVRSPRTRRSFRMLTCCSVLQCRRFRCH